MSPDTPATSDTTSHIHADDGILGDSRLGLERQALPTHSSSAWNIPCDIRITEYRHSYSAKYDYNMLNSWSWLHFAVLFQISC